MSNTEADAELLEWAREQDFRSSRQRTISRSVSFSGRSLVDGRLVQVTLHPGDPYTGLVFKKKGPVGGPEIPVSPANVCRSSIYIALTQSGWRGGSARRFLRDNAHRGIFRYLEHLLLPLPEPHVALVEHFLAVAYLLVDNLVAEVEGDTLPYMSFQEYFRPFKEAGIVRQTAARKLFTVATNYRCEGKDGQLMEIEPGEDLFVEYSVDFSQKSAAVGEQRCAFLLTPETFIREVSCARSLFLLSWRRFVTDIYKNVDYSTKNLSAILVADGDSYLNTGQDAPRYLENGVSTEVARHKVGDLLGEMAVTGTPILGRFRIHRGGHHFTLKALNDIIQSDLLREL